MPLGPEGDNDRGDGPRATPTVEGAQLWVMTESGGLACLNASDGGVVWRKNALTDFKGRNPHWLLSESPLVDGERLILTPGGRAATIVALDKQSGKWIWSSQELNDAAVRILHRLRGGRRSLHDSYGGSGRVCAPPTATDVAV